MYVQCHPKVLGQFGKFTKFIQPHNSSSYAIQPVFSKTDTGYQTIWIEDQAQRFVGPDLRSILFVKGISLKINTYFEIVRKYFILF